MQTTALRSIANDTRPVSPEQAITRIRALQAQRWPESALAARLGYDTEIPFLLPGCQITREMNELVAELYDEIGDHKGPSAEAEAEARRLGYWPAIHYDDDMSLIRGSIRTRWQGDPDRHRRWLLSMALTARGVETTGIVKVLALALNDADMHAAKKQIERARKQIGLRLNSNLTILEPCRVMSGQDALLREIHAHTAGIAVWERIDDLDEPGLDYEALWLSLCDTADLLHGAGEAGTPASSWPTVPEPDESVAATLSAVAA